MDSIINVAMHLFSNRSQMTSKCGKNKEVAHEPQASVSLMFSAHFDVQLGDLLLNGPMTTKNLFVLYNDQKGKKKPIHIPALYHMTVLRFVLVL